MAAKHYQEKIVDSIITEHKAQIEKIRDKGNIEYAKETELKYRSYLVVILKYLKDQTLDEEQYIGLKKRHNDLQGKNFKYQKDEDENTDEWFKIHQRIEKDFSSLDSWTSRARAQEKKDVENAEDSILYYWELLPSLRVAADEDIKQIEEIQELINACKERLVKWKNLPLPQRWFTPIPKSGLEVYSWNLK